ncbi:uncharacterized protein UV8b_07509 [Ustilaginoidea virens]|uniref:Uncharacterized protein n=1 Tax=Ustilaginoidea virens TaxID=1159556 RepID=A0A8E5MK46_USTVR|nr:uncharacterized protein UV8b_07509 [Ustilaginoidea virens]QUC23268.1 hypothetical protein UV8b_07509 [Ustilaginoidea virens]
MRLPAILASAALLNVPAFATPVDAQNALDRRTFSCTLPVNNKRATVKVTKLFALEQAAAGDRPGISGWPKRMTTKTKFANKKCNGKNVKLYAFPINPISNLPFRKDEKGQPLSGFTTIYAVTPDIHLCGVAFRGKLCPLTSESPSHNDLFDVTLI